MGDQSGLPITTAPNPPHVGGGSGPDATQAQGDARHVAPGSPQGAQEGAGASPLAEDTPEVTVAHVTGGKATGGFKHGGYTILAGRVDARSAVARRMRTLAERIAKDTGFDGFASMPAVRQVTVMAFCRTAAAADAMWSAFQANGRLPDKFWELTSLLGKYAALLGMARAMKSAKPLDLHSYVWEKYGRGGEEGASPTATSPSSPVAPEGTGEAQEVERS